MASFALSITFLICILAYYCILDSANFCPATEEIVTVPATINPIGPLRIVAKAPPMPIIPIVTEFD